MKVKIVFNLEAVLSPLTERNKDKNRQTLWYDKYIDIILLCRSFYGAEVQTRIHLSIHEIFRL